jgi:hypothetical protein
LFDRAPGAERPAEGDRIFERLRRALTGVWQHRMSRVSEQGDGTVSPVRERRSNAQLVHSQILRRRCGHERPERLVKRPEIRLEQ